MYKLPLIESRIDYSKLYTKPIIQRLGHYIYKALNNVIYILGKVWAVLRRPVPTSLLKYNVTVGNRMYEYI